MKPNHVWIFVAVLAAAWTTAAFAQGVYWESTTTGKQIGEHRSKSYAMPKKFKTVELDEGSAVIVRLDRKVIIGIDSKAKTYRETTFDEMEAAAKKAGAKMSEAMDQMEEHLKDMPEEQRKMMEQMMGKSMAKQKKAAPLDVKNTGERKTISGFGCVKYVLSRDGKELTTLWTTKSVKGFDTMRKDWEEFIHLMMEMDPLQTGLSDGFRRVEGFPIQTVMGDLFTTTVTKVEQRSTPDSEFEVPAGYTREKGSVMGDEDNEDRDESE